MSFLIFRSDLTVFAKILIEKVYDCLFIIVMGAHFIYVIGKRGLIKPRHIISCPIMLARLAKQGGKEIKKRKAMHKQCENFQRVII